MKIIALLNSKGGTGKTTLAVNLAEALHRRGRRVVLLDTDPQRSAERWDAERQTDEGFAVLGIDAANLKPARLEALAPSFDVVVIDGAGKADSDLAPPIRVADVVLIPCGASPLDVAAVGIVAELIRTRQTITEGQPRAAFIVSRAPVGTLAASEVSDALAVHELPVLVSRTHQRVSYADSLAGGGTVYTSGDAKAVREIESLTDEVDQL